jgi:hypothetical protein
MAMIIRHCPCAIESLTFRSLRRPHINVPRNASSRLVHRITIDTITLQATYPQRQPATMKYLTFAAALLFSVLRVNGAPSSPANPLVERQSCQGTCSDGVCPTLCDRMRHWLIQSCRRSYGVTVEVRLCARTVLRLSNVCVHLHLEGHAGL